MMPVRNFVEAYGKRPGNRIMSVDKLGKIEDLCKKAIDVLESDGEYHAENLADQILAIIADR